MQRPIRLALAFFVVIALAVIVFVVVQVTSPRIPLAVISAISYRQAEAVPGFSDTQHSTTDLAQLRQFDALAQKYGIDLAHYNTAQNDVCTGGLGTTVIVSFEQAATTAHKTRCSSTRATAPKPEAPSSVMPPTCSLPGVPPTTDRRMRQNNRI